MVKIPEPLFFYRVRESISRDHSLRLYHKIGMLIVMILRHKRLYLGNMDVLLKKVIKLAIR